jgi:hypothetical protein
MLERHGIGTLKSMQLFTKSSMGFLRGWSNMDGIKTDKLDAVRASINANAMLQKDFDAVEEALKHKCMAQGHISPSNADDGNNGTYQNNAGLTCQG